MKWIIPASEVEPQDQNRIGGKGYALATLLKGGFQIPQTLCLTNDLYSEYLLRTGLRERILLELHRKDFEEMRWEEIWDCATRIRSLFLRVPLPADIDAWLRAGIESEFGDRPTAVRSSAPDEDASASSFAGLHESYLNIKGSDAILEHVRKVWASLWSDAALLYRKELGLDIETSTMGVVIQEIINGDRSGVAFSINPVDDSQGVVESVYGLNQGLVDGVVEPDRWILDRDGQTIVSHVAAERKFQIVPDTVGVRREVLPAAKSKQPPLEPADVLEVFNLTLKAEIFFNRPQDIEWTFNQKRLFVLQARPITTASSPTDGDKRSWYLSLHRSFENLGNLRRKIEEELIPGMITEAKKLAQVDPGAMTDIDLIAEIERRWEINQRWANIYWDEFIPFAHGVRLFGQVYNDLLHPDDPYEFIDLLTNTEMASLERNRMLEELAGLVRRHPSLAGLIKSGQYGSLPFNFTKKIDSFIERYGDLTCTVTGGTRCDEEAKPLFNILLEMAANPNVGSHNRASLRAAELKGQFLNSFDSEHRKEASEMLALARSSYQLRDDDNIHLGRIESHFLTAIQEARRRVNRHKNNSPHADALAKILTDLDPPPEAVKTEKTHPPQTSLLKSRQITGQPAGPGIARGTARVVRQHADLAEFKYGEVLICDAVDPNMTFVVPLAAAVIERRGGMLIHGAIIAREYGLPCVTGIPDATARIHTGDEVTVDGYLGIVTVGSKGLDIK